MGDVKFEIRTQEIPVPGWVVVAHFAHGREKQLVGVYTAPHFAEAWIEIEGENWIRRHQAELE